MSRLIGKLKKIFGLKYTQINFTVYGIKRKQSIQKFYISNYIYLKIRAT